MTIAAIVGSHQLAASPALASKLVDILMNGGHEAILVRSDKAGSLASSTEELATKIADRLGSIEVQPLTTKLWEASGSRAGFLRDQTMAENCDVTYAFFLPETVGTGGTWHVVEAAMRKGREVHAFAIEEDEIIEIGDLETEGEFTWS